MSYPASAGSRYPVGATLTPEGVNFSVFSRHATRMELLLYERADSPAPFQTIALDPEVNRTFFVWHVFVAGLRAGVHYTWRADGPADTQASGRCFNPRKQLCDPWARAVSDMLWDRARARDPADDGGYAVRAVVSDPAFDWGGVPAAARGLDGAVIYELHVGGFTRHPSAGVAQPGTFAGLIEKIPYLGLPAAGSAEEPQDGSRLQVEGEAGKDRAIFTSLCGIQVGERHVLEGLGADENPRPSRLRSPLHVSTT